MWNSRLADFESANSAATVSSTNLEHSQRLVLHHLVRPLQKFNTADHDQEKVKTAILTELLGTVGHEISVGHNFHYNLGYNVHAGENFYAGFNCTILDMAEVKIGGHHLIAPNVGICHNAQHMTRQDRPALLLIDIQQGMDDVAYSGGNRNNPQAEKNARRLLHHWR